MSAERQPDAPCYNTRSSGILEQVARLRLMGYAPAAIRHLTGLTRNELDEVRREIKQIVRTRLIGDARDILRLQANRRVELAQVARGGEVVTEEVFGAGPVPRSGSPALNEDGDPALPAARVLDAEELCGDVLRELGWAI